MDEILSKLDEIISKLDKVVLAVKPKTGAETLTGWPLSGVMPTHQPVPEPVPEPVDPIRYINDNLAESMTVPPIRPKDTEGYIWMRKTTLLCKDRIFWERVEI